MAKEFPSFNSKPIHYYYGLNHYIVLGPGQREKEDIHNETRSKMALSTVAVALNNTQCPVPCFVQVMDRDSGMFNGIGMGGGFRTNYEMIVLKKRPPYCDHLTGLLTLFKTKIKQDCASEVDMQSVKVSARFSFLLEDWTSYSWSQPAPDMDMFSGVFGSELVQDISKLPFGTAKDPIRQLILHATWQDLPEEIITDNDVHSDLDLMEAPAWSISTRLEDYPQGLLSEYLKNFHKICDQEATIKQLLGEDFFKDDSVDKNSDVFNRLTGTASNYTLSSIIGNPVARLGRTSTSIGGPIKPDHLIHILDFLFPDAAEHPKHPYPEDLSSNKNNNANRMFIKTCPIDGLVWRLTIVFGHILHVFGSLKPLAHLMHEFLLEVRFRFENGQLIPGLPLGVPDNSFCLLHQKLQMINCCIERKIVRDSKESDHQQQSPQENVEEDAGGDTSDEDIFFDCDDEDQPNESIPIWSKEPVGRAKKLKIKLLQHDEYMYVPITQVLFDGNDFTITHVNFHLYI